MCCTERLAGAHLTCVSNILDKTQLLKSTPNLKIVYEFTTHDDAIIEGEHDALDGIDFGVVCLTGERVHQGVQRMDGDIGQLQVRLVRNDVLCIIIMFNVVKLIF